MEQHKKTLVVGTMHEVWLSWAEHINQSALLRNAIEGKMRERGADPTDIKRLVRLAEEQGCSAETILNTGSYQELRELVREAEQHQLKTEQYDVR